MVVREIDLGGLRMHAGEGRRLDPSVSLDDVTFSDRSYRPEPCEREMGLDVSRMLGGGYSLRLRFTAGLSGPCVRCLAPATAEVEIDAREHDQPGSTDDQLSSPYVEGETLRLERWANDSFVFALPQRILCREDCRGLCPECGVDLNADPDHHHEERPDPRWAALSSLRFDEEGRLRDKG